MLLHLKTHSQYLYLVKESKQNCGLQNWFVQSKWSICTGYERGMAGKDVEDCCLNLHFNQ
jgi:hypothetical protein